MFLKYKLKFFFEFYQLIILTIPLRKLSLKNTPYRIKANSSGLMSVRE